MERRPVKKSFWTAGVILLICISNCVTGYDVSFNHPDIDFVPYSREKRASDIMPVEPETSPVANTTVSGDIIKPAINQTDDSNRTTNSSTVATPTSVTQIPLLGQNGTGIRKDVVKTPQVSDPILPDDNITTDIFKETPEILKAEQNITNLKYDNHEFYNSSFIGNVSYFNEYWANISKPNAEIHKVLSNSHRRATTLRLSFKFPFYGHNLTNVTVATGGFLYTGEHVHNWLAATQYIAPLMANFDTTLTNDSVVKMYDDGSKFTAFWENVTLQEDTSKKFTFAVTLYKNGDISFAYKTVPIAVQNINDSEHPVKVGISDAYLTDKILFLVRRKTIYEYHRVTLTNHEIASNTILKLTALPTCVQYNSCNSCVNHNTGFDCMWCDAIHKCSSGTDRNKQDWLIRNCDRTAVTNSSQCLAEGPHESHNDIYTTDSQAPSRPDVRTMNETTPSRVEPSVWALQKAESGGRSAVGGIAAFVVLMTVAAAIAWVVYAFKNPHTRSGQLLIKYRPSQWSWRRGEARYTAATIHM